MSRSNQENDMNRLLGSVLKEALAPTGIDVSVVSIPLVIPPDADIIACKRNDPSLSGVVRDMLQADGLRDNTSSHVAIHFHREKRLKKENFRRSFAYSHIYLINQKLERDDLHSFLVVTRKLKADILKRMSCKQTEKNGVYMIDSYWFSPMTVIVLDELDVSPHNEMLKSLSD